ncbi:MAG: microcin C transport system ATP-binding protein [Planctomycetota bacterium]|jgi:microcin C transport system ATP-binding protein
MRPLVDVQEVDVAYADDQNQLNVAIRGVSFSLEAGGSLGIAGETGAGKSTLARAIAAMETLTRGQIWVDDSCVASCLQKDVLSPAKLRQARRQFQILFQDPSSSLSPRMTVESIIAEGALAHGLWQKSEVVQHVEATLRQMNLASALANRYPNELSGGERRRVALARIIVLKPKLLILDEPTAGLDAENVDDLLQLLSELRQQNDVSLVVVSHDLAVLRRLSDEIMVMRRGQVLEKAPTEQFFHAPETEYSRALIQAASGDTAWIEPQARGEDPLSSEF